MKTNRRTVTRPQMALTALALAIAPVSQTMAQLMPEEVVVTAQKRPEAPAGIAGCARGYICRQW